MQMNQKTPVYFIQENEVKDMVKLSNPSLKVGTLDIPVLEKKLNQISAVDSANVYLNLNGNLNLDITQRVPVFRVKNGEQDFYVDAKGIAFSVSKNYSFPCMLVSGNVKQTEYKKLAELISKINEDTFSKKFFIGISKHNEDFNLLTSEGFYRVELGNLDRIDFKVKGFKAFVTKVLINENPEKYSKISLKYDNQIVTTLNPNFDENDSIITANYKELQKVNLAPKVAETLQKKSGKKQ